MLHIVSIFVSVMCLVTQPASKPASQPATDFEKQLESIDARAGAIVDLSADFMQEKRSPMLRKPLVSRGTVRAKGGRALWDTREPERSQMSFDPTTLRIYYPAQKSIEEYPMRGQLGMMAASPLPRLSAVRESFKLIPDDGVGLIATNEKAPHVLAVRMEPSDAEMRKFVDHVRVLLDVDRGMVIAFEMIDADGEQTVIRFTNPHVDRALTDDQLKIDAPAGTNVVRPLEPAGK